MSGDVPICKECGNETEQLYDGLCADCLSKHLAEAEIEVGEKPIHKPRIVVVSQNIFGHECLKEILKNPNVEVSAVISRKYTPNISDHFDFTEYRSHAPSISVYTTSNINEPNVKNILYTIEPDFIFVFGWSQIIDEEILDLPTHSCIGTHPSLLPKNRGSAAIPWQILNNEPESGLTFFQLANDVDSGDILLQESFPLDPDETATSFYIKIVEIAKHLLRNHLDDILSNSIKPTPQDHTQATFLCKRTPSDGLIGWHLPATDIDKLIRATARPYPGAYTFYRGHKIVVYESVLVSPVRFTGIIGQIVHKGHDSILVQTGDGLLSIMNIDSSSFHVGDKLG